MRHQTKIDATNWIMIIIAALGWAAIVGGIGL